MMGTTEGSISRWRDWRWRIRGTLVPTVESFESFLDRKLACQKSNVRPRSSRDHFLVKRMPLVYIGKGSKWAFNVVM